VRAAQTRRAKTKGKTTGKPAGTRKSASALVVEEQAEVQVPVEVERVEQDGQDEPAAEILRRTRSGRVCRPARKVAEKRRREAYS
jgi:hypothetical protein